MFSTVWFELLLDTERKADIATVLFECFNVNRYLDNFSNWKRGKGRSYYEHIGMIADRKNLKP